MKRTLWRWAWALPLAVLIGVGLSGPLRGQPASDPAGASSGPGAEGGAAAAVPSHSASAPGETPSSGPAGESQPAPEEDEGDGFSESQPISSPGAGTSPTSGPVSRPMGRGAYSRPTGGYPSYGDSPYTRTRYGRSDRNDRNDRNGRTRGGAEAAPTPAPVFGPGASWNDFSVVATRNIFIKDRTVREPRPGVFIPGPPPTPTGGLILTGIALVEDPNSDTVERVAFLDNSRTGVPMRASVGQVVDGGRVLAVQLDGIQYEKSGVRRWIALGEALTGGRVDLTTAPTAAAPTEVTGAASTSAPAGGGAESILERMRRKRQQEMR